MIDCMNGFSRPLLMVMRTLVTPVNDSFFDLDVVAMSRRAGQVSTRTLRWFGMPKAEGKQDRALSTGGAERLSDLDARNKREMETVLKPSQAYRVRIAPGFSERVIFHELFLQGLTMLDIFEQANRPGAPRPRMSHIAARQEVRGLVNALQLPERTPRNA